MAASVFRHRSSVILKTFHAPPPTTPRFSELHQVQVNFCNQPVWVGDGAHDYHSDPALGERRIGFQQVS
jgi:hypothetical protein